ncbi:Hypothetical protein R9X50_00281300 [Acrodontium crateriforme]|uniref:PPM-type phosphatase domain-containing protein n=1 Tax=Acrodontium crateriforme TaxID=150365 RepID=A0AAQ3M388_9PEZI|nr:Hypothetical protein R9X50_00281300 [Acrodontium crateriforme]
MWAPVLRAGRTRALRQARFGIRTNASSPYQGPPKTYFQPPPQPPPNGSQSRIWRLFKGTLILTTGFFIGGVVVLTHLQLEEHELAEEMGAAMGMMGAGDFQGVVDTAARVAEIQQVPAMDFSYAQEVLTRIRSVAVSNTTISHVAQVPSNSPCEDTFSMATLNPSDSVRTGQAWNAFGLFDGHAGPKTSFILANRFLPELDHMLAADNCYSRPYTPNDQHIVKSIKKAFVRFDEALCEQGRDCIQSELMGRSHVVSVAAFAFAGSCALVSIFDEAQQVFRVACTGDSRAVLGRWDSRKKRYVATALTVDQTGFNQSEVERLAREHPGETTIDPKTGRIFGLAITRAFGDTRWKWAEEITVRAHELFWGPAPRPNNVIKTPPYLTAEPEVTETRIQSGAHPDFVIMASDGLWDLMSNDNAVACVEKWLEKFSPVDMLEEQQALGSNPIAAPAPMIQTPWSTDDLAGDDDTYWDPEEKALKWRVSPKHFVVEDISCATHLIKNAFGGKRRNLFTSVMTVQHPLSRKVRDDTTVNVTFFGQDMKAKIDELERSMNEKNLDHKNMVGRTPLPRK